MYGTPCVASADLARHDAEMDRMYAEERYIEDLVAEEQDALATRIMRTQGWPTCTLPLSAFRRTGAERWAG